MPTHLLRRVLPRFQLFRVVNAPILPTAARLAARSPSSPSLILPRQLRTTSPRLPSPSPAPSSLPPDATLSQRLKHLIKSYGWYALGVYLVFSALDFTVAFVGINLLGAEQVSQAAAYIKEALYSFLHSKPPEPGRDEIDGPAGGNGGHEGLYAMLVLAYTIHKTLFLPVRVGLTAALTPRIVGWLRARGWASSEGARRAAGSAKDRMTRSDRDL